MAREELDELADGRPGGARELSPKARRLQQRNWWQRLSDRLIGGPERPGEQKIGRSPIVMILAGSTIGALVLSGIFWFMISSTREQRALKEATLSLTQERYADAETQFLSFVTEYPESGSIESATIGLHRSRVEKNIMPDTPNVVVGLEELDSLLKECRELPGFSELKDDIRRYADRLTFAGARMAEITQDPAALDVSRKAMQILLRYAGDEGLRPERQKYLEDRQRLGEAAIAKKTDFDSTLLQITQQMESGATLGAIETRGKLLDKYPLLADDKDVTKALQSILAREKEYVVRVDLGRDALGPDQEAIAVPSVALALRTQAATDLTSQGRAVFTIGIDSCFAVDADTGEPLWRRALGADSPFAPIAVTKGSEPGVLVYSTLTSELQMLSQKDGHTIWRQPCESALTGEPLVTTDMLFVTTAQNELLQVSIANGRAVAKLKFSQPIVGPPALSSDGQKMVLPGDQTLVYTLGTTPLSCLAVSHIPHRTGSVRSPMLAAGRYFLMCDNNTIENARVQTLEIAETGLLTIVATDTVEGQVNDPCVLRGLDLIVPSTPQKVTAFRVTDGPGEPPLSKVGANQLEDGIQTRMFLLAGPGGQLWLAGRDLRKFQTRTNTVLLDDSVTAEGVHLRPILFSDQDVFLTTGTPRSTSVFLTRVDREQMKGIWRTVLGTKVVALAGSTSGQSLLAIADYGESYRISLDEVAKGGFIQESISRFRLPDKLDSEVRGLVLTDGRPAAWCGGSQPAMWTFTTTGQLDRRWPLPASPETDPVAIAGGVVFAMPGRLHMSATASGQAVADYQSAQTGGNQQPWKSLTALSPTQMLGITGDNQFVRVEFRTSPRPQLAEISVTAFPQVVEVAPAAADGFVALATADGKLLLLQAATLEVLAEADLGGLASTAPVISGGLVFVDVSNQKTLIFKIDNMLTPVASLALDGHLLAGPPMVLPDGGFLVGRSDGLLTLLDASGAPTDVRQQLGQGLQQAPRLVNGAIVAVGLDGSLYRVDPGLRK